MRFLVLTRHLYYDLQRVARQSVNYAAICFNINVTLKHSEIDFHSVDNVAERPFSPRNK